MFTNFYTNLQKFIFSNKVIVAAAGISIGVATNEAISNILKTIVLPLLIAIKSTVSHKSILNNKLLVTIIEVLWIFVVWLITILFIFIFLEYFLNRSLLRMVSTIPDESKTNFVKAKLEAKQQSSTLDEDEVKQQIVEITNQVKNNKVDNIIKSELKEDFNQSIFNKSDIVYEHGFM